MHIPNLILSSQNAKKLIRHSESCFPAEACGLLAGKGNRLLKVIPVKNIEENPKRFKMDPQEQVQAFMEIESSELDLLAIYHSHPDGSCGLSQIDLENFFYPGVFSVLLFLEDDTWKINAFRISEKKADEINLIFT